MGKQSEVREQFLQATRIVSNEITLRWLTASPLDRQSADFESLFDLDQVSSTLSSSAA
jgi:hypothetical protein